MLLYVGPGVGIGTIVLVGIVLGIIALSFGVVITRFIKRMIRKSKKED